MITNTLEVSCNFPPNITVGSSFKDIAPQARTTSLTWLPPWHWHENTKWLRARDGYGSVPRASATQKGVSRYQWVAWTTWINMIFVKMTVKWKKDKQGKRMGDEVATMRIKGDDGDDMFWIVVLHKETCRWPCKITENNAITKSMRRLWGH